jgi:hypothetical protein
MASKKNAAKRFKQTGQVRPNPFERDMNRLTPEQAAGVAREVSEKTGRPVEEVVEAMSSEARFIMFLNDHMPKLGALQPGDIVRPKERRDRTCWEGGEIVGRWPASRPQEAKVKDIFLRRNGKPVMVRVTPLDEESTGDYLFMDKFQLEKVEDAS